MCVTDLIPDPNIAEHEHQAEGTYPGVAWGRLAEHRDGQDDLDGQDVARPRA
jgi:hypothetical protein